MKNYIFNLQNIINKLKQTPFIIDDSLSNELDKYKIETINDLNEKYANKIWCLKEIYCIHKNYIDLFNLLKKRKYEIAWNKIDEINKSIGCVRLNFDENCNDYFLEYISEVLSNLEKLFPYKVFTSREMLVTKEKCNICGKIISPRGECNHIPLKLYMGKLCQYIVEEAKIIAIALVSNPMDKYAVLIPEGQEYDYKLLDSFIDKSDSPYKIWVIKCTKQKKDVYRNTYRNDLCPCGSGKKYKKCCLGTIKEFFNIQEIIFINAPKEYPYDYKKPINEWVNTVIDMGFRINVH